MASVISFPRREVQIVGLISLAHFLSHFYLYSLVPHYESIAAALGVGLGTLSLGITANLKDSSAPHRTNPLLLGPQKDLPHIHE